MPGGRPRKPTALKVLGGTARPDRLNPHEPQPAETTGRPPAWLKGQGRRVWRWLVPLLREMRVLTAADEQALALLCDVFAEYLEAREILRQRGLTYETTTPQGDRMVRPRPEVAIAADAWRRVQRMLTEFGLTPSARSRVQALPAPECDPFEELLASGS